MKTICCPWDDGAVSGMFSGILEQKTVKTRCGRRAAFKNTSADRPTCPRCLAQIEHEKYSFDFIMRYAADVQKYGIKEANERAEAYAQEHPE